MRSYYSKIILSGEYTILKGGSAYAIPSKAFHSRWEFGHQVDENLQQYLSYLQNHSIASINLKEFEEDIKKGLQLSSTIPLGMGLGSSGNLVAAVYDRYKVRKLSGKDLIYELQLLEAVFHKKSSGIDPLVIYKDAPVEVSADNFNIQSKMSSLASQFYLFNSNINRTASGLVKEYLERCIGVQKSLFDRLKHLNDQLTAYLLAEKEGEIGHLIPEISELQYKLFEFAIPSKVADEWRLRKRQGQYMKLCGAGGGGFYLVWSPHKTDLPCVV